VDAYLGEGIDEGLESSRVWVRWLVCVRVLFWRSWEDDGLTARFATWIRATAK